MTASARTMLARRTERAGRWWRRAWVRRQVRARTVPARRPPPPCPPLSPVLGWLVVGDLELPIHEVRLLDGRVLLRARTSQQVSDFVDDRLLVRGEDGALVMVGGPRVVVPPNLGRSFSVELPLELYGVRGTDYAANYSW